MDIKISKKIYIIILNWNNIDDTIECLNSLRKIENAENNFKIVIVDNASKNQEIKKIFSDMKLFANKENRGFAAGNNTAISYCLKQDDCGYIMLLNNDTAVEQNFIDPLLDYLDKNPKSIVSPKILYYSKPDIIQTMGGKFFIWGVAHVAKNKKTNNFCKIIKPDALSGACIIAPKEVFKDAGLFDENYFSYLEDADWSLAARQKKYELAVIPESIIYHKHSQSTKGSFLKTYLISRNNIYFAKKHFKGFKKYLFILSSIIMGFFMNLFRYKNFYFLKNFIKGIRDGLKMQIKNY
ncbi:MAG: glycosyltransferase family 2 protein [bacterium]